MAGAVSDACAGFTALGVRDLLQTRHAILRNYPIVAHLRFLLEFIRPEMRQYFIEDEKHGAPFCRATSAVVYQRAKVQSDKRPFGTQLDVYGTGYEWINHSMRAKPPNHAPFRMRIGGPDCAQPYDGSIFNISAMSFGSLSAQRDPGAERAAPSAAASRTTPAKAAISPLPPRARRRPDLGDRLAATSAAATRTAASTPNASPRTRPTPQVKMIEIKLSARAPSPATAACCRRQGHAEIAATRGVPMGGDCISPAGHSRLLHARSR